MTDYEAWKENKEENYKETQFELSIHRCSKCNAIMRKEEEKYDLSEPYKDVWWECVRCGYTENA